MNKKLQVFVSSTYTDLIEERQAAVEAILDAGHIPAGMELFKAGKSQMKTIKKWIEESDVYMLILGGRYGSIEEDSNLSYTQLEYEYALTKNIPIFSIVLDDNFLHQKASFNNAKIIFEKDNIDKYDAFKKIVKSNIVKFINNIDQIASVIHSHLNQILNDEDYHLVGWTRGSSMIENKSKDFKSLTKILQSTIAYVDDDPNSSINYYDVYKECINDYFIGVSETYRKDLYRYYSKIYLFNELLESIKDENGNEVLQLTKLGNEYYNYIILNE